VGSESSEGGPRAHGRRLRVLFVCRKPLAGQFSIERVFTDVADAMPRDIDARLVELPHESRGLVRRVRNLVFTARLRADVIHITGDVHYCALSVRRGRCVLTVHDLVSMQRVRGPRRWMLALLWYRLPVAWASRVTVISESVRDALLRLVPGAAGKVTVVSNPVGPDFVSVRNAPGDVEGSRRVLQIGTGVNKNLARVASALEGLDAHLHVVGRLTQEQQAQLDGLSVRYSHSADLTDEELRDEYARSAVLAFVSTYEGFGLPIVEAQAMQVPVVTSREQPMARVSGGAAVLVDPLDVASIRSGIALLLDDRQMRAELIAAGTKNCGRFSADRVSSEYAQIYRSLATRDGRGRLWP